LEFSDEEDDDIDDDDEYEYAPTIKEHKIHVRERERERKSSTKSNLSSLQNSFIIPHESVFVPMGTKESIDKMLAYRTNPENNAEEILVKYKTMSYLDIEWIHRKKLEEQIGKVRVRKFIEKYLYSQTNWSVDEIFNPNFTKIDRIIDEGELGDKIYYLVKWKINRPDSNDRIAIYKHNRLHDTNYTYIVKTDGKYEGSHIFKHLSKGFYDVRLLRGKDSARAEDVEPAICCIGEEVKMTFDIKMYSNNPFLQVYIPKKYIESPEDWIAMFPSNERSNKVHKCIYSTYINSTNLYENDNIIIRIPLKYIYGDFNIKYFYSSSCSIISGNVYSGICNVSIPNYDKLTIDIDVKQYLIKIHWKIYSTPPNPNQWIGIYDIQNKLITYEYVSNNIYLNDDKTEGIVIFKKIPKEIKIWNMTNQVPFNVLHWNVNFYNGMFSHLYTTPIISVPFYQKENNEDDTETDFKD